MRDVFRVLGGNWLHPGKIAVEKYFMCLAKRASSEPIYERHVLKTVGIERLER